MKFPNFIRITRPRHARSRRRSLPPRQPISRRGCASSSPFPPSVQAQPVDGRVYVIVTRNADPEPRLQFGKSGGQYGSMPFLGENVDALAPGQQAVIDGRSDGYPLERLGELPAGDYFVQGFLNVYTTFHRADGRVVKMHMDQWEGQNFPISPGNLYSAPRRIHLDPAASETIQLVLDRRIPPDRGPEGHGARQARALREPDCSRSSGDTRSSSGRRSCSRRTTTATPASRTRSTTSRGTSRSTRRGGSRRRRALPPGATDKQKERARRREEFTRVWLGDGFPRMLFVTFQHPTPYYDDSYAIDSPNNGPYGRPSRPS